MFKVPKILLNTPKRNDIYYPINNKSHKTKFQIFLSVKNDLPNYVHLIHN